MKVVDKDLLASVRARRRCECCNRPTPAGCHPHHYLARGLGSGGRLDVRENLVALCIFCHDAVHRGIIPRGTILALIARREHSRPELILGYLYMLQRQRP